jgi:hypothetical protein
MRVNCPDPEIMSAVSTVSVLVSGRGLSAICMFIVQERVGIFRKRAAVFAVVLLESYPLSHQLGQASYPATQREKE